MYVCGRVTWHTIILTFKIKLLRSKLSGLSLHTVLWPIVYGIRSDWHKRAKMRHYNFVFTILMNLIILSCMWFCPVRAQLYACVHMHELHRKIKVIFRLVATILVNRILRSIGLNWIILYKLNYYIIIRIGILSMAMKFGI